MMLSVSSPENFLSDAEIWWIETALEAIDRRGCFEVALSGGGTPARLYRRLAANRQLRDRWELVRLWFGDERCVPSDDPQSNFRMVHESELNEDLGLILERMEAEKEPKAAAEDYANRLSVLSRREGGLPRFDLVMLGVGEDGHVASLFPGSANLDERKHSVSAAYVAAADSWRLSITMPVIAAARRVLVLVTGENKAEILAKVLREHDPAYPATEVARLPQSIWLVDKAAASSL